MSNIKVKVLGVNGKYTGKIAVLDPRIFQVKFNPHLVKLSFDLYLANSRNVVAHTKTRGERQGSTAKIYRQKGTGRARQGQNRAPHRKKGGVVFGPRKNANFSKSMPRKMRRLAMFSAISKIFTDGNLHILENVKFESPNTKQALSIVSAVSPTTKNLFIDDDEDKNLRLSFRNIPMQKGLKADSLNIYDLVIFDKVFITESGLDKLHKTYLADGEDKNGNEGAEVEKGQKDVASKNS